MIPIERICSFYIYERSIQIVNLYIWGSLKPEHTILAPSLLAPSCIYYMLKTIFEKNGSFFRLCNKKLITWITKQFTVLWIVCGTYCNHIWLTSKAIAESGSLRRFINFDFMRLNSLGLVPNINLPQGIQYPVIMQQRYSRHSEVNDRYKNESSYRTWQSIISIYKTSFYDDFVRIDQSLNSCKTL